MDAAVIYKQLDDFRAGTRSWGAMNAIAQALSAQDAADVGAYFASRGDGLPPFVGDRFQAGHTLRDWSVPWPRLPGKTPVLNETDPPPIWWTPMLGFRAARKVSDEHNAPGISGSFQTRSG